MVLIKFSFHIRLWVGVCYSTAHFSDLRLSIDIDYDAYPCIDKGGGANPAGVSWVPDLPDLVYAL